VKTYSPLARAFKDRAKPLISCPTESQSADIRPKSSPFTYPMSRLKIKKYRVSSISPAAICKDRSSSRVVRLPKPWAMFAATEADALRTCDVTPNISFRGNPLVSL